MKIQCATRELSLEEPKVMGILNVTPDSFSDGGSLLQSGQVSIDRALIKAEKMIREGASIVDVGGESTRPGADEVCVAEELDRVIPVIEAIHSRLDVVISVDTSRPQVITQAAAAGAGLINDVRALQIEGALQAAAATHLPVCLMHMKGDPQTMQHNPQYENCVAEVQAFLEERLNASRLAGIDFKNILVDPGIGFGKKDQHNLELIKHLSKFTNLGAGLLFGVSRKSMIGRLLGRELGERLAGSLGFALIAMQQGAKILRVHDVAETVDTVRIFQLTR